MPLVDLQPAAPPTKPDTTLDKLRAHFPFPTIRPVQDAALSTIAQSCDEGTQFTAIEAPTGSGKSGIGFAAALWSSTIDKPGAGAHYLTSQNSLTQQLVKDFGDRGLVRVKGKSNYFCDEHGVNCGDGSMLNGGKSCEGCPYRADKNRYVAGKLGVTNYTYYLTETMHSGELTSRTFLIADEAHNIEREILSLVNVTITQNRCDDVGSGRLPRFEPSQDDRVRSWLKTVFVPDLDKQLKLLDLQIGEMRETGEDLPLSLQKRFNTFASLERNIQGYLEADPLDWLAWSDKDGNLLIKPLTAELYANKYLFRSTPYVILMSATILDFETFRRNLGIPARSMRSFAVPSEFPARNRRIVFWPVGSMGAKNIDSTLPRLAERILALLTKFQGDKGLIHTHSYRINSYLEDAFRHTPHGSRIVTHTGVSGSRERAIADHCASEEPTILMSPSMTEGLDLKGDLSRIQIITKVPYPFLDPYNRTRMDRDPKWYQLQTALTLVQATGRSVRSEDDYALTVILDSDFQRFLSQNQDILPAWWLDSIEFR